MSLKHSYTLIAPFYDLAIRRAFDRTRAEILKDFPSGGNVLISGIGTGLDLPHLPPDNQYVGLDLTRAMLDRATARQHPLQLTLVQGDSQRLPFDDASFDHVILHLILAVVPHPEHCLAEAARVLKPGGTLQVLDKFLRPDEKAPMRRLANILIRHIATRTDVVFEHVLQHAPSLNLVSDQPLLGNGWFRCIRLEKSA